MSSRKRKPCPRLSHHSRRSQTAPWSPLVGQLWRFAEGVLPIGDKSSEKFDFVLPKWLRVGLACRLRRTLSSHTLRSGRPAEGPSPLHSRYRGFPFRILGMGDLRFCPSLDKKYTQTRPYRLDRSVKVTQMSLETNPPSTGASLQFSVQNYVFHQPKELGILERAHSFEA